LRAEIRRRPLPNRGRRRPAVLTAEKPGLAETLRPDDERFSRYTISGVSARNWSSCFSEISNQIVLRLGGPPEQQVVVGVWHLAVPRDGRRVALEDMLSSLNARYPILQLDASGNVANGFHGSAFADAQGGRLDHAQIESDYRNPAPPAAPQPPRTTEGCGFLLLSTCPRTPPQSEIDAYEAAMRAYDENSRSHQARMRMANAYGRCVLNPPRSPGEAAIDETSEAACGPAYYAAAFPYPGGLTEAYYIGVYDHRAGCVLV
jgi:hypothetical protein